MILTSLNLNKSSSVGVWCIRRSPLMTPVFRSLAHESRTKCDGAWIPRGKCCCDEPHRLINEMLIPNLSPSVERSLELPVDTLLERARPLPPHAEMVIEELTPEEGAEFSAALKA